MSINSQVLYEDDDHQYIWFSWTDSEESGYLVQSNQVLVIHQGEGYLMDPGGAFIFSEVADAVSRYIDLSAIRYLLATHQDPDVLSSVTLWLQATPAQLLLPELWIRFVSHFGFNEPERLTPIPDCGMELPLGKSGEDGVASKFRLVCVPAHFLHSEGNFSFYDTQSRILFSGDIGTSMITPQEGQSTVQNWIDYLYHAVDFHKRYMANNYVLRQWVQRIRAIDPQLIVPQHGLMIGQDQIPTFLNWLEHLQCGTDCIQDICGEARTMPESIMQTTPVSSSSNELTTFRTCRTLYEDDDHQVILFSWEEDESNFLIQTNQCLIIDQGIGYLLDPGGTYAFAQISEQITRYISFEHIQYLIATHQDPDVCSSAPLWMQATSAQLYISRLWLHFVSHFGLEEPQRVVSVPDAGMTLKLPSGNRLVLLPAHFLHSEGNFSVWDECSGILFSGDIGASIYPWDTTRKVTTEDFPSQRPFMEPFHKRYMHSNAVCQLWVNQIRQLSKPVQTLIPQHGTVLRGAAIEDFLDWLAQLQCGGDYATSIYTGQRF